MTDIGMKGQEANDPETREITGNFGRSNDMKSSGKVQDHDKASGGKESASGNEKKHGKRSKRTTDTSRKRSARERKIAPEITGILEKSIEIEKEIEGIGEGRFTRLEGLTDTEKLLIFKYELLNSIKLVAEYKNTAQRVAADMDNYRKRAEKEREAIISYSNEDLITKMLDVLDNLDRALQNVEDRMDDPFIQGIQLIHKQFIKIMGDEGLESIEETGIPFDPYHHDAMMQVANNDLEENTITDIFLKGYILKKKVIRPAKVIISKKDD